MTPSHELRIKSMLRAMTEVLIPALDPKQQLAMDQAQLIVGNLKLLLHQHDKTYQFAMVELREYCDLLADLAAASGEAPDPVLATAAAVAGLPIPTENDLVAQVTAVKEAADRQLSKLLKEGSPEVRRKAQMLVLAQSEAQVMRERAWVLPVGFEMNPESLPPMEELLAL